MDKIINILLLVIIFVFDPLAISLVVAANFAFSQAFPKKKFRENLYGEKVEVKKTIPTPPIKVNEIEVKDAEEITSTEEFLDTLDQIEKQREEIADEEEWVIKEEDDEWDDLDLNQDGVVDEEEINIALSRIKELQTSLKTKSLSGWRRNKIVSEIENLKSLLPPEDDLTITY